MNRKTLLQSLERREKISFDGHISLYAEFVGCDPAKLQDEKFVASVIFSSIVQGRMKMVDFFIKKFEGGGGGVTAAAIVSDSHIIVNTYPEATFLMLDVYACSGSPINVLYEFVRRFKPKRVDFVVTPRTFKDSNTTSKIILSEEMIKDKRLIKWLKERNLLPLISTSEEFFIISNFIGFVFGDGHLHKNLNYVSIWQKYKYILDIMGEKLRRIGVKSKIIPRKSKEGKEVFELRVTDRNFCKLLYLLGTPKGSKTKQKLKIPFWIDKENIPIVGAFLSSLLFSEISKPNPKYIERKTLTPYIVFMMETSEKYLEDLITFFEKLSELLKLFKIKSNKISVEDVDGKKKRVILQLKASKENLMRIQALTSLTKIFTMGVFDPTIAWKNIKPLYSIRSGFYKIIDYLLENGEAYDREIFRKIGISEQNGYKWIKVLKEANIVLKKRVGKRTFIRLNTKI